MTPVPDFETFKSVYDKGRPQVVSACMIADLETPVSAMLKLAQGRENSFLLESVEGGATRGRYSIIGFDPDIIFRSFGDRAEINRTALQNNDFTPCAGGTVAELRALLAESRIELADDLPPMAAGVFGYMGYDMVRLMENLAHENPEAAGLSGLPDTILIRPTLMVIFDSVEDNLTLITPSRPSRPADPSRPHDRVDAKTAYAQALERLEGAAIALESPASVHLDIMETVPAMTEPVSNTSDAEYKAMVNKAKDYIAAGDVFQVVLSQRFEADFTLPPFALYRALRRTNPSPFLYFLNFSDFSVVGSSPEILVRVRDGKVTIRPIAGTRRRGRTPEEDRKMADELITDPKERAEHLMLLDLGRNDTGRVCKTGTVKVTEQFSLEYYSQVIHIVSNVEGELAPEYDAIAALIAGFPAGTVSGAPKVRAMEIIDELEKEKRGIYAGCVGYFSANGDMDTCIVLRTAVVKDGRIYVQAGAGIVADSKPELEQKECHNKALALFRAAEEAIRFARQARRG